jgi:hypothetical protein
MVHRKLQFTQECKRKEKKKPRNGMKVVCRGRFLGFIKIINKITLKGHKENILNL